MLKSNPADSASQDRELQILAPTNYTDILFTGQRLDGTGLYYYNARYYDPAIGRFISADTIIPNPTDPQSFNRYSYCLNNPLKHIDPSGHDAYVNDWNVEVIDALLSDPWLLAMVPGFWEALEEVIDSPEYQAYETFRNSEEGAAQAAKLEELDETVNIEFGDTGNPNIDSIMGMNDGEYTITINQNIMYANDYYVAGAILSASYYIKPVSFFPDLSDFPTSDQAIIAYDIAAIAGDITSIGGTITGNPVVAGAGYWSSNVAAVNAFLETWNRYNTGRASGWDLVVSGSTTVTGAIPYIGIIPASFQLWWDTNH